MGLSSALSLLFVSSLVVAVSGTSNVSTDCSCGFYDAVNDNLFTDSIIVYFNETTALPADDFLAESYMNKYEQGWNSQFRQGASPANVDFGNSTTNSSRALNSMQLFLNPSDPDHTVVGGGLRTLRQDIQYGSFRAFMKSPPKRTDAGSSLSMMLQYNMTQAIKMNLQNTNAPDTAWVSTLLNHESPNRYLGVNYADLSNTALPNYLENPWGYNTMRIDWTPNIINFWIGNNLSRSVPGPADDGSDRPSTPSPFTLKHWSVGDEYAMAGPPMHNRSEANVLYLRLFFNTSSMSSDEHSAFDDRCHVSSACSTEDLDLRGSTPFPESSTGMWQQADGSYQLRWPAVGLGSFGLSITIVVFLNVVLRRLILPSAPKKHGPALSVTSDDRSFREGYMTSGGTTPLAAHRSPIASGIITPLTVGNLTIRESAASSSGAVTLASPTPANLTRPSSVRGFDEHQARKSISSDGLNRNRGTSKNGSDDMSIREAPAVPDMPDRFSIPATPLTPFSPGTSTRATSFLGRSTEGMTFGPALPIGDTYKEEIVRDGVVADKTKKAPVAIGSGPAPTDASPTSRPVARQRVDYLAGLVAFCSTLVSLTHYMLTFLPATIEPGAFAHYPSENWARKTVGWFLFNEVWVVMFFTTSTRFLTTKYLRGGDLGGIAEKVVGRVFRLMIPITGVIILEYFLMDAGAIDWLQYLPSISWSTWPYTVVYSNFGSFISETLELIYLIPNAQPQITFNYCTGVLWTIPVQLQGSWQAMLGIIVIREIKTPWKRFGYYAFSILNHWYARSWGSFFMAGLLLADLDITFKYRKWLYAHPLVYFPLLNLAILLTLAGLANDLISQWTGYNFQTIEHGWHPDKETGLMILNTPRAGFPPYYTPKLNGLIFAICSQLIVEWSSYVQKVVSTKVFLWMFPHIFTIYLFHGFVFWSVGAWICVGLGSWGIPYWANMLITALGSYAFLFASLPIITPVVEALGKSVTISIWTSASEQPAPKRATLYPFPTDLFTSRTEQPEVNSSSTSSSSSFRDTERGEKGKTAYVTATEVED